MKDIYTIGFTKNSNELLGIIYNNSESMANVVYKFFDNLLQYGFIEEIDNSNSPYFYRCYRVVYEDLIWYL